MKELNANNFDEEVARGLVLVDFWAEWCGPCKRLDPIYRELSQELKEYKFTKLDVDSNQKVARDYGVRSIPTILLFKNGKELGRITGLISKEELKNKVVKLSV